MSKKKSRIKISRNLEMSKEKNLERKSRQKNLEMKNLEKKKSRNLEMSKQKNLEYYVAIVIV